MVFIPIADEAPASRSDPPYVTYAIIAVAIAVFLWQQTLGEAASEAFDRAWGVVPGVALGGQKVDAFHRVAPFVTYMFLHGGWAHIFGNMLFLWIFGDDIEDAVGHARFLLFYLACGIVGALVYCWFGALPDAPLVGASGAIAGVMGAYLMIRPCAHVRVLVFIKIVAIRAMWVILFWAGLQVWHVLAPTDGNTAWWAHIGGIVTGALLIVVLRAPGVSLLECLREQTFVSPWGRSSNRPG